MGLIDSAKSFLQSDVVKNGVREMMIARPEDNADLIWKHPDQTIPMFAQCTVRADEWGVFSKEGRPVGTLDAGRCTLSAQNIPFLSNFIDQYTGGNFLMTELFFVKRTPFPKKFGGSLGNMIDPMTQIRLRARCHGEILLRVENPETLIYQYFGMRKFQEHADIFDWFVNSFFNTVKSTIGKLAHEQRRSVLDIMDMQDELAAACVANATELAQAGIRIAKVTQLEVDVPEEDVKRFDEMRQKVAEQMVGLQMDEIGIQRAALQAQAAAAAAQVSVQTAQYQAQANQFALDQKRQQDAAYVQMAGGDINRLGQFEAMRGAGSGLAQGGVDECVRYAAEREAFGQTIGHYQAIAFKIADMEMRTHVARTAYHDAGARMLAGEPFKHEASIAKLFSSEIAVTNAREATQVFGGYGYMNDYAVARFWRDAKILEIGEGTSEVQRMLIARHLGVGT